MNRTAARLWFVVTAVVVVRVAHPTPVRADITVGGSRPVEVYVPPSCDPDVPVPLVLLLHASGPTTLDVRLWQENYLKFKPLAERLGFAYACPNSTDNGAWRTWNSGEDFKVIFPPGVSDAPIVADDTSYLAGVIEDIKTRCPVEAGCTIDPDRVYLVGHSSGATMTYRMACHLPDTLAAIAALGGPQFVDPGQVCPRSSSVHVLQICGTSDPYAYDPGTVWGYLHPGVKAATRQWAAFNGCSQVGEDVPERLDLDHIAGEETRVTRYTEDCSEGGSAELWIVEGGIHVPDWIPDGNSTSFAAHVYDWLLRHPSSAAPRFYASFIMTPDSGSIPLETVADASGSFLSEDTVFCQWDFGDGAPVSGPWAELSHVDHVFTQPGRFLVGLKMTAETSGVTRTAARAITALCAYDDPVPAPWKASDVGPPLYPGRVRLEDVGGESCFHVCAGGMSVPAGQFHFTRKEETGDFVLTARVSEISGQEGAALGLMARDTSGTLPRFCALLIETQPGGTLECVCRYRAAAGMFPPLEEGTKATVELPVWLRMERRGEQLILSTSGDGESWGAEDELDRVMAAALAETLLVGMAASGNDGTDENTPFTPLEARLCVVHDPARPPFLRGDSNADGTIDLSDAVFTLGCLFLGADCSTCDDAADANDDGGRDLSDAIYTLTWNFLGGRPPPDPGPFDCGPDPTDDPLDCARFDPCGGG